MFLCSFAHSCLTPCSQLTVLPQSWRRLLGCRRLWLLQRKDLNSLNILCCLPRSPIRRKIYLLWEPGGFLFPACPLLNRKWIRSCHAKHSREGASLCWHCLLLWDWNGRADCYQRLSGVEIWIKAIACEVKCYFVPALTFLFRSSVTIQNVNSFKFQWSQLNTEKNAWGLFHHSNWEKFKWLSAYGCLSSLEGSRLICLCSNVTWLLKCHRHLC